MSEDDRDVTMQHLAFAESIAMLIISSRKPLRTAHEAFEVYIIRNFHTCADLTDSPCFGALSAHKTNEETIPRHGSTHR